MSQEQMMILKGAEMTEELMIHLCSAEQCVGHEFDKSPILIEI